MDSLENIGHWKTRIAVGRMAFNVGLYSQAARHFKIALDLLKDAPSNSELRSINLVCLGKAISCLGKYSEAESLINEALQIDSFSSANILELARDYIELASIYRKQNRSEQCEACAHKVLDLIAKLDSKERIMQSPSIARAYKLLAILKDEKGQYDEGLKLIDRALTVLENMPQGSKTDTYGEALMVKVMLLVDKGEVEQVDEMLENAIQLVELHKGLFHPQLIKSMNILIDHMKKTGRQSLSKEMDQFSKRKITGEFIHP